MTEYPRKVTTPNGQQFEIRTAALDTECGHTWYQWPRLFNDLFLRYNTPPSLYITLHFFWSACVGYSFPKGTISLAQIPVAVRELRKWRAALLESDIFEVVRQAKLGDQKGSDYQFNETSPRKWEWFFHTAATVARHGAVGDHDVTPEDFGDAFAWLKTHDWKVEPIDDYESLPIELDEATKDYAADVLAAWMAAPLRAKKKGG